MSKNKKRRLFEFDKMTRDIRRNKEYQKLKKYVHHGGTNTLYQHSISVAYIVFVLCLIFKINKKIMYSAVIAALLHDFYDDVDLGNDTPYERLYTHPHMAVVNAKKYFELNETQENIIESHMFPMSKTLPKYKEAVLVSLMDKSAATYEMAHFKLALKLSMLLIFLYNVITIEK